MKRAVNKTKGFTLVELIIVIAIFSLIFSSATVVFGDLIGRNSLKYHGYQLVQNLREARTSAVVQKNDSAWGIYFNNVILPYGYTFFKGDSYGGRDATYDLDFEFPAVISISQLDLGGEKEIVFSKSSGSPLSSGSLTLTTDKESYTVFINTLGLIDFNF